MKRNYLLLFILLPLFIGCKSLKEGNVSSKTSPSWLNGHWKGVGLQMDGDKKSTWTISLDMNIENKVFKIKYPSLNCSGTWKLIEYSNYRASFEELITNNTMACVERGKVILTKVDDNHVSFSYYFLNSKEVSAFSTLKRK